jgi:hypothetical protein
LSPTSCPIAVSLDMSLRSEMAISTTTTTAIDSQQTMRHPSFRSAYSTFSCWSIPSRPLNSPFSMRAAMCTPAWAWSCWAFARLMGTFQPAFPFFV